MYLRSYYSNLNPDKSDAEVEEFVNINTSEYAVGGRVGLEKGGRSDKGKLENLYYQLEKNKSKIKKMKEKAGSLKRVREALTKGKK